MFCSKSRSRSQVEALYRQLKLENFRDNVNRRPAVPCISIFKGHIHFKIVWSQQIAKNSLSVSEQTAANFLSKRRIHG
jgi:hypothetical protein